MPIGDDIAVMELALKTYGIEAQTRQTVEECAELIVALSQLPRGRTDAEAIVDELADVQIMVWQLALHYGLSHVDARVDFKLRRLQARLDFKLRRPDEMIESQIINGSRHRRERAEMSQTQAGAEDGKGTVQEVPVAEGCSERLAEGEVGDAV